MVWQKVNENLHSRGLESRMRMTNLQVGCSDIVALLECFSNFHVIIIQIYPLLSISMRDTCFPKRYHELALKRLEIYLKHTQDRGKVLD